MSWTLTNPSLVDPPVVSTTLATLKILTDFDFILPSAFYAKKSIRDHLFHTDAPQHAK